MVFGKEWEWFLMTGGAAKFGDPDQVVVTKADLMTFYLVALFAVPLVVWMVAMMASLKVD